LRFDKAKIKKILLIKFGGIGDVVCFIPVLPNLRNSFPDAEITVLIEEKSEDLISGNPYINDFLVFNRNEKKHQRLYKEIKNRKFNAVFDFFGTPRTAYISFISRARYRIGFNFRIRKYAYNIKAEGYSSKIHNLDFNLRLLEAINVPIFTKEISIDTSKVQQHLADSWFESNKLNSGTNIGIIVCGGWDSKTYKQDDYVELLRLIETRYLVNFVLFWGSKKEKSKCEFIKSNLGKNCYIAPDLNLKSLVEFYKHCTAFIGSDSGPLHLAVTSKKPVLGIFGPVNPMLQGPYGKQNEYVYFNGLDCLFCNLLECPIGNKCLKDLPKNTIVKSFEAMMKKNNITLNTR